MPPQIHHKLSDTSRTRLEKFFGTLELEIMEFVWQQTWVTVREVQTVLNRRDHSLAYTTVMTILGRLYEKGWLISEKRGRAHYYRAKFTVAETEAVVVGDMMRALLQNFGDLAITQFVKELDDLDPTQLERLARLARHEDPL